MKLFDKLFNRLIEERHIRKLLVKEDYNSLRHTLEDAKRLVRRMNRLEVYSTPIASVYLMVKNYLGHKESFSDDTKVFRMMDNDRQKAGFNLTFQGKTNNIYGYITEHLLAAHPALVTLPDYDVQIKLWVDMAAIQLFDFYKHLRKHSLSFS